MLAVLINRWRMRLQMRASLRARQRENGDTDLESSTARRQQHDDELTSYKHVDHLQRLLPLSDLERTCPYLFAAVTKQRNAQ